MSMVRILGIGSPFGDDDLGWRAIDILDSAHLADRLRPHAVELRRLDRPGPMLIEALVGADLVLILDAMSSGGAPGTLRRLEPNELESVLAPVSSHGLDLPTSLALARSLNGAGPEIAIIGIEMAPSSVAGRETGPPDLADRLIALVDHEIRRRLETRTGSGSVESRAEA